MHAPYRFRELQVEALPFIITHIADAPRGSHADLFLMTGSDLGKLALDYFGIAYAEAVRYHQEHPPFELHDEQTLDGASRGHLLEQHRRFCRKPFRSCGIADRMADRIVDELVLNE